ncbi:sugar phosphate isomerase/epimerase [Sporolactobacillus sp. THM7-4]|nr:sugar phosphate isomerase/epimerase [Sporolactobacillus sp. THM7-4]
MRDLFINTLVYKKQLDARVIRQSDLFSEVRKLGAAGIEVRREYFYENGKPIDLEASGNQALKTGLKVFYSVPEKLFVRGQVTRKLEQFFKEGEILKARNIKLNVGEPNEIDDDEIQKIQGLMDLYHIHLTVENDQTRENGRLVFISEVLSTFRNLGTSAGFTFDVGNWLWQGEDPLRAAQKTGNYATVFHLKDVSPVGGLHTVLLDQGDVDWKSALAACSKEIPIVIEYPINGRITIEGELRKVKNVLIKTWEGVKS